MTSERVQRQIDRLLDEAEEALAQRDRAAVRERVQHALALDPDNSDARGFLAAADRALGNGPQPPPGDKSPSPWGDPLLSSPLSPGRTMRARYVGADLRVCPGVATTFVAYEEGEHAGSPLRGWLFF